MSGRIQVDGCGLKLLQLISQDASLLANVLRLSRGQWLEHDALFASYGACAVGSKRLLAWHDRSDQATPPRTDIAPGHFATTPSVRTPTPGAPDTEPGEQDPTRSPREPRRSTVAAERKARAGCDEASRPMKCTAMTSWARERVWLLPASPGPGSR